LVFGSIFLGNLARQHPPVFAFFLKFGPPFRVTSVVREATGAFLRQFCKVDNALRIVAEG
jgi:hypothetical protein